MTSQACRRRNRLAPLLLAALGLIAAFAALAPRDAEARPFETGIAGIGVYEPIAFERTKAAGAGYVRLVVDWAAIAPKARPAAWDPTNPADPHYDWEYMDTGVRMASAHGLNPVMIVDGAPLWAQRCATPPNLQSSPMCDPNPGDLATFATAAARRYSGTFQNLPRAQYWQGLNEPNLTLFFFPQMDTKGRVLSAALYRDLINAFYAAVKAVDPSNLVLAAGLGPTELKGYNIGPMRFTRELLCMKGRQNPKPVKGACKGGVHFDIFDIHPYSTAGPKHEGRPNDVQMGDLPKLMRLIRAADKAKRIKGAFKKTPVWITEFGWDSNPPDPGGLPMKILTQWSAEAMHGAWLAGVTKFFWYTLRDEPFRDGVPASMTVQSGLYLRGPTMAEDQPKEVLATFRFPFTAYAHEDGLAVWGRTPTSSGGMVKIEVFRGGKWRKLKAVKANGRGVFNAEIASKYGKGRRGAARAVFAGQHSVPFPMRPVPGFRQAPFG
jgi:hypothetical protein